MKLSLLLIGWFLHTSSAFTFVTRTRLQVRNNYDRLSFYSTTSDQQLLTEDTDFIQRNIEFATSTTSALVDTDSAIATSTNVQNRFDRVVGPKRALIYDTTLRGRCFIILLYCCCIVVLPI